MLDLLSKVGVLENVRGIKRVLDTILEVLFAQLPECLVSDSINEFHSFSVWSWTMHGIGSQGTPSKFWTWTRTWSAKLWCLQSKFLYYIRINVCQRKIHPFHMAEERLRGTHKPRPHIHPAYTDRADVSSCCEGVQRICPSNSRADETGVQDQLASWIIS